MSRGDLTICECHALTVGGGDVVEGGVGHCVGSRRDVRGAHTRVWERNFSRAYILGVTSSL